MENTLQAPTTEKKQRKIYYSPLRKGRKITKRMTMQNSKRDRAWVMKDRQRITGM